MKLILMTWHTKSIVKEFKKMKFKAIFRYLYDKKYKAQIDYLATLTAGKKLEAVQSKMIMRYVSFSHFINYPGWVSALEMQINMKGPESIEPIKVIWDERFMTYIVVDGNHRLKAFNNQKILDVPLDVIILKEAV